VTRVLRIDRGELSPPERMDNGWLRVDGKIARVGIQEYEDAAGKMHRELRIPEEVFDAASLRSFELVPVTNTHPPVLLDDRNCRTFQVGQTGQAHRQDGDFVVATMMLTDADAILSAQAGRTQLSNGYTCELDPTQDAELVKKWGTYDFLQRKIRGNHIALVDAARAGPEARIRLDKAGNAVVASPGQRSPAQERIPMKTITLDGIVIDTEAADAQSVINRTLEAMKKRADDALSAERSRATGAEKKLAVVKDNAKYLVAKVGGIRLVWDAMKARMATCEECDGSGKVMDDGGKEAVCGYCDGKGSYRMHDMVKAAAAEGDDPDDDDDLDDAMEEAVEGAESTDEDELEVEQATEEGAGKAAKKADAAGREKRRREQARKDAARDRELLRKKRSDSRDRQIRRSMERRLDLEMNARRYLDEEDITAADLRKLDDAGVMKAIVKKLAPESKLDGKSAVEIRARYDAEVERAPAFTVDSARDMAMRSLPVIGAAGGNGQRTDGRPKDPRAAYLKRLDEQAKGKGKQATGAK
jgi:hypothetical protein